MKFRNCSQVSGTNISITYIPKSKIVGDTCTSLWSISEAGTERWAGPGYNQAHFFKYCLKFIFIFVLFQILCQTPFYFSFLLVNLLLVSLFWKMHIIHKYMLKKITAYHKIYAWFCSQSILTQIDDFPVNFPIVRLIFSQLIFHKEPPHLHISCYDKNMTKVQ